MASRLPCSAAGTPVVGCFCASRFHQRLGLPQELLVRCGIGPALLDKVVEQLRHLLVEPWVGELVADDGLANVVDDAFGDGVPRELALLVELPGDGVVDAGLDDQLGQRQLTQLPRSVAGSAWT